MFDTTVFSRLAPQWVLHYAEVMDSTSTQAKASCVAEYSESGHLWLAEHQTAGVGRRGTNWTSPAGGGLWFTCVLEAQMNASEVPRMALAAGLAVAKLLESYGLQPQLKWPNDIYVSGKKVCGILVEQVGDMTLFGIGLNTHIESFPAELNATSIMLELEALSSQTRTFPVATSELSRERLLSSLLTHLISEVSCCKHQFDVLLQQWERYDFLLDKQIQFHQSPIDPENGESNQVADMIQTSTPDRSPIIAIARGISKHGYLLVEFDSVVQEVASASQIRLV